MSKSNGNGVDKKGVKLDLEDTTEYGTKPEQPEESVRHDIVIGNGEDERLKQSTSRKAPKVTFTVTRVSDDDISSSSRYSEEDGLSHGSNNSNVNGHAYRNNPSAHPRDNPPAISISKAVRPTYLTVPIPDGVPSASGTGAATSDSEYGDTLTQTSITKLLSKKFKSYRTYRYNLAKRDDEREPSYSKRLHSKYESQDYDQIENVLFLNEQTKDKTKRIRQKWLARWIVSFFIGIGTAIVATIIEVCIEYAAEYKFLVLRKLVDDCTGGFCVAIPLLVWVTINGSLVFVGSCLVTYLEPQATGSGIPQVKCYLNGVKLPGLLTLRALAAKAIGVTLSVAGGLACGKEGPMIHSGAIVAAGISQGRSKVFNHDFKIFEYLRSDTERRDFVSGGAAAGVAAAFGAPVGGVLFSLEEGASFWNQSLTWRIVFASMVATFGVNVLLSAIHGHPADLSNPGLISFGKFTDITYQAIEIPIFLLMAVFGGLSGALFNFINCKLTVFRKRYVQLNWTKVLEAVIVAVVSGTMGFALIYLFSHDCVPNTDLDHKEHIKLHCPEGHHNIMAHIFFKTPEASLISVLHDDANSYSVKTLSVFTVLYWILACWTYGLSVSSGIFIPCLLTGAAWGRLTGVAVLYAFPKVSNNIGKYALIGAACQLGGTVRMTISLTVILIECTGDITFGLPIVMVLTIAKWVGDFFNHGLYDLHIQMMGIPLLHWEPPEMSYDITADQVMNKPVVTLKTVEKVNRILEVMVEMPHLHSGFPVVLNPELLSSYTSPAMTTLDGTTSMHSTLKRRLRSMNIHARRYNNNESGIFEEEIEEGEFVDEGEQDRESSSTIFSPATNGDITMNVLKSTNGKISPNLDACHGRCEGLILRSQLVLLLKYKVFTSKIEINPAADLNSMLKLKDFRDAYPRRGDLDISLTEEEKNSYIDLRPYMNPTPYTVLKDTSLPRMFKLFRGLGLRHLVVVDRNNQVLGMVTRKDLAKYRLHKNMMNITVQQLQIHSD